MEITDKTKIISKTIKIKAEKMPIASDFIEKEILKQNINPVRWAIVEVENNTLFLSISGYNF